MTNSPQLAPERLDVLTLPGDDTAQIIEPTGVLDERQIAVFLSVIECIVKRETETCA